MLMVILVITPGGRCLWREMPVEGDACGGKGVQATAGVYAIEGVPRQGGVVAC